MGCGSSNWWTLRNNRHILCSAAGEIITPCASYVELKPHRNGTVTACSLDFGEME